MDQMFPVSHLSKLFAFFFCFVNLNFLNRCGLSNLWLFSMLKLDTRAGKLLWSLHPSGPGSPLWNAGMSPEQMSPSLFGLSCVPHVWSFPNLCGEVLAWLLLTCSYVHDYTIQITWRGGQNQYVFHFFKNGQNKVLKTQGKGFERCQEL